MDMECTCPSTLTCLCKRFPHANKSSLRVVEKGCKCVHAVSMLTSVCVEYCSAVSMLGVVPVCVDIVVLCLC